MALLGLIVLGLAASVTAVPFIYYNVPSSDPNYANVVDKLKKVLKKEGHIQPRDIKAISNLQSKDELYRTSYKAFFYTKTGKECYYKWRDVLYSTTNIAEHKCTMIPKVLLPRKTTTTTTTTEEPTTEDSDSSSSDEDTTTTTTEERTTEDSDSSGSDDDTTTATTESSADDEAKDAARALRRRTRKK